MEKISRSIMGELVRDGVLGPTLRPDECFVGVLVYGDALVGVLERTFVEEPLVDNAEAEGES
jgi:hypothetical protein